MEMFENEGRVPYFGLLNYLQPVIGKSNIKVIIIQHCWIKFLQKVKRELS